MKALILKRPGFIGNMQVMEVADPQLSEGKILVSLKASSLNPLDYKMALAGFNSWKYPHISGIDGAGIIEAVADDLPKDLIGRKVVFQSDVLQDGCFAEKIVLPLEWVTFFAEEIDCLDAATLPCAGLTAYEALTTLSGVRTNQVVLIQGGAGGVGGYAIQIAKQLGAKVLATCSPNNFDYVKSLGADELIDYSTESLRERVMDFTQGKGVQALIDTMGSSSANQGLNCIGYRGHLVCLSGLPDMSKYQTTGMAISIHDMAAGTVYSQGSPADIEWQVAQLGALAEMMAKGSIRSTRTQTISMKEIPQSLEDLRNRHVRGKIVADLTIPVESDQI